MLKFWKRAMLEGKSFRPKRTDVTPAPPPPIEQKLPEWAIRLPECWSVISVRARTKSEARAEGKRVLRLGHRDRLPVGTKVERVNVI